ncbi:hypothetical protein HKX48_006498 [Thoreauomyces humboldtii]|nr:hypothetical protein HKX48_006498 [Thoreauomyces humboldtii]
MTDPSQQLQTACVVGYMYQNPNGTEADAIGFCVLQLGTYATSVASVIAAEFGGPGMVVGACWPFLAISIGVATSRMFSRFNARSVFLMMGTIGNLVFTGSIAYALHSSDADYAVSDRTGSVGLIMMIIFLCMAGITRFCHVITKTKHRQLFQRGLCSAVFLYGIALGVLVLREVANSQVHPTVFNKVFVALFFIPLLVYLLGGLFCFSWNLPSSFGTNSSSAGGNDTFTMLKTLRLVNDIMMGIIATLCVSELSVVFPLRTSGYNNAIICLHVTIMLFVENIFETVTNALRGKGAFSSGLQSDKPSELSNMRTPGISEPYRTSQPPQPQQKGRQVGPDTSTSYAGRETWAFGGGPPSPYGDPYGTVNGSRRGSGSLQTGIRGHY